MTRHPLPPNKLINLILLWTESIDLYELHTVINALQHCISQLLKQRSPVHEILQNMFNERMLWIIQIFQKISRRNAYVYIKFTMMWYQEIMGSQSYTTGKICVEELNKKSTSWKDFFKQIFTLTIWLKHNLLPL